MPVATGRFRSCPADSCATCHKDVKGITSAQIADGSAFDLTKEQLAYIAAKDLAAQPAPAKPFPAVEVPETVTIGALSNDFEPSVFPHRKIYEALVKGAADSGLASAFHTSPTGHVCRVPPQQPHRGSEDPAEVRQLPRD